jgi:hypothetical protein
LASGGNLVIGGSGELCQSHELEQLEHQNTFGSGLAALLFFHQLAAVAFKALLESLHL